jgi:repressor LexA
MIRFPGRYDGLTVKQADLLSFIRVCAAEGHTPSFVEMQEHMGLASKSGVHRLMAALKERGYVEQAYHRARSVVALDRKPRPLADSETAELIAELTRRGFRFYGQSAEAA